MQSKHAVHMCVAFKLWTRCEGTKRKLWVASELSFSLPMFVAKRDARRAMPEKRCQRRDAKRDAPRALDRTMFAGIHEIPPQSFRLGLSKGFGLLSSFVSTMITPHVYLLIFLWDNFSVSKLPIFKVSRAFQVLRSIWKLQIKIYQIYGSLMKSLFFFLNSSILSAILSVNSAKTTAPHSLKFRAAFGFQSLEIARSLHCSPM